MRVPALLVAVPLLAGSAAGVLLVDSIPDHLILASAAAALLCVMAGAAFAADGFGEGVVIAVCLGAASAGLSSGASTARSLYSPSLLGWHDRQESRGEPAVLEGRLRDDVVASADGPLVALDVVSACDMAGACTA